jgi:hypothetical protein
VAANDRVAFTATFAEAGETETEIAGGGVMVTVYIADLVGSATAMAVIVAVALLATLAGASYSTEVLFCLLRAPGPESFHVTPWPDGSPKTVTVIVTGWPCAIV